MYMEYCVGLSGWSLHSEMHYTVSHSVLNSFF